MSLFVLVLVLPIALLGALLGMQSVEQRLEGTSRRTLRIAATADAWPSSSDVHDAEASEAVSV